MPQRPRDPPCRRAGFSRRFQVNTERRAQVAISSIAATPCRHHRHDRAGATEVDPSLRITAAAAVGGQGLQNTETGRLRARAGSTTIRRGRRMSALCSRRIDSTAHQSRRGSQVQASQRQINWHQLQECRSGRRGCTIKLPRESRGRSRPLRIGRHGNSRPLKTRRTPNPTPLRASTHRPIRNDWPR
jgi:hypothetical protein